MASRRSGRSNMPLEWVAKVLQCTDVLTPAVVNDTLDFDLLQDEVAEILKIDSQLIVSFDSFADLADEGPINMDAGLSMDPSTSPSVAQLQATADSTYFEDLETYFTHKHRIALITNDTATAIDQNFPLSDRKVEEYWNKPILVGTNSGMSLVGDVPTTAGDVWWFLKVYFKRRKASVMELNQILLKRR